MAVLPPDPCPGWSPVIISVGGWKGGGGIDVVKMTMKNKLQRKEIMEKQRDEGAETDGMGVEHRESREKESA